MDGLRRRSWRRRGVAAAAVVFVAQVVAVGGTTRPAVSASPPADLVSAGATPTTPTPANDVYPSISADGRFVAYSSQLAVSGSPQLAFVRDRQAETTEQVPALPLVTRQYLPTISSNGCFVVYWGYVEPALGGTVFFPPFWVMLQWDRCTPGADPQEILLGHLPAGESFLAAASVGEISMSGDGRYVAWTARDSTAIDADRYVAVIDTVADSVRYMPLPGLAFAIRDLDLSEDGSTLAVSIDRGFEFVTDSQVYAWNLGTDVVELVSATPAGLPSNGRSVEATVSADGSFVAFVSDSSTLLGISSVKPQLYVRDRQAGTNRLVSPTPGVAYDAYVFLPEITRDGSQIVATVITPLPPPIILSAPGSPPPAEATGGITGEYSIIAITSTSGVFTTSAWDLVSFGVDDLRADGYNDEAAVSATGRFVAWTSNANDDLSGDGTYPQTQTEIWARERTPALAMTPSLDFGVVNVGTSSAPEVVTLSNVGKVSAEVGTVGAPSGPYSVTADFCSGTTLAPGASCTIRVVFRPVAAGSASGSLVVTAEGITSTTSLRGTGRVVVTPAALSITPASVAFPDTLVGALAAGKELVVRNVGGSPVTVDAATFQGGGAASFVMADDGCKGKTLTPNATCTIVVASVPKVGGASPATLSVTGSSSTSASATLTVTGFFAPRLVMNPGVVRPGDLTVAQGEGFPPGVAVVLTFSDGTPFATVTPDAAGSFTYELFILRNGVRIGGNDVLAVDQPGVFAGVRAPLLIDQASFQPSGTASTPALSNGGVRQLVGRNG